MTPIAKHAPAADLIFEPVPAAAPWQAFRLPFSAFPLAAAERSTLTFLVQHLSSALSQTHQLEPTLWLDTAELHRDGGSRLFSRNARLWSPTMGFAFDPTGPAPRTLEMSDLMDIDYGTPPKIFTRSAIFVSNLAQTQSAYSLMAGRGLAVTLFFPADPAANSPSLTPAANAFIANSLRVLQPMMQDGAFQNYGFYLPLLSSVSMSKADPHRLQTWLADAEVYLHESLEDKELFLLARRDLTPAFENLGMRRLSPASGPVPWALPLHQLSRVTS